MFDAIERLDACVNSSQIASNSNAEVNYFLDSRAIPPDVSVLFTSGSLNSHNWIGSTWQDVLQIYVCCLYFVTTVFVTVGFGVSENKNLQLNIKFEMRRKI